MYCIIACKGQSCIDPERPEKSLNRDIFTFCNWFIDPQTGFYHFRASKSGCRRLWFSNLAILWSTIVRKQGKSNLLFLRWFEKISCDLFRLNKRLNRYLLFFCLMYYYCLYRVGETYPRWKLMGKRCDIWPERILSPD